MSEPGAREPGYIEIDRGGAEPVVKLRQPQDAFTLDQLRSFGTYLVTVADETAAAHREPELEDLAAVIDRIPDVRFLPYESAVTEIARAILDAGYKRDAKAPA